jgi:ApaG protein
MDTALPSRQDAGTVILSSETSAPMPAAKHQIDIRVETSYVADQSEPEQERYVFSYTITILNQGEVTAKLLDRHWVITDANGKVQEVRGDGVVGHQPELEPGQGFQYTSGAVLETPIGSMRGEYGMVDGDGEAFVAPIPAFTLSAPRVLH